MKTLAVRMDPGSTVSLDAIDPDDKGPFDGRNDPEVANRLERWLSRLSDLQELLFAEQRRSLLVVLQAMDTAGKDGVLRRVGGPLDSRGVQVASFKAPHSEELAHDYLWRVHARAPRRGDITFFNRSHYEDVLAVRVLGLVDKSVWKRRYDHINAWERMLTDEGTTIVKIYLHISKDEQKRRLEERLADADKRWKFDPADLKMRALWDELRAAYEDVFARTSTDYAPWHVVPANRKWYRDLAVAQLLCEALERMDPRPPHVHLDPKTIAIPD
jgi:PPK2 family polyphosphate:nucleotide phosphotransferase